MDEPGWAWPAWKFGLKRDDLFGKLHDQYNTFASTIQDPEAFHHDVYEISNEASDRDEFHRLMAARKAQRLRELNESLESASFEIIANPQLIGTEQWQYALQLFRTKSLDSLVRYFASYLPEDHFFRHHYDTPSSRGSSFAETCSVATASTKPSTIDDIDVPSSFFPDGEDKPILTHEPFCITSSKPAAAAASAAAAATTVQLPPSPRSITMRSDAGSVSCDDVVVVHEYTIHHGTPARTLSFSGSESERFAPEGRGCHRRDVIVIADDDEELETSQSDYETPVTSESELADSRSSLEESVPELDASPLTQSGRGEAGDGGGNESIPAQVPFDTFDVMESETPTPRQEASTITSYIDSKQLPRTAAAHRASSPRSTRRREGSPLHGARRSPDESFGRVHKAMPDPLRARPKGRRRLD
jgi:hypothetical protein